MTAVLAFGFISKLTQLATNSTPTRIHKGLELPAAAGKRDRYDFDGLEHGDAIEVRSPNSAMEMFRRWKKKTRRKAQLVRSADPNQRNLLFFIEGAGPKVPVCDEV